MSAERSLPRLADQAGAIARNADYGVCAEVDGNAAHPADEQWRDKRRDNENNIRGIVTLRFGFPDVSDRCCETAATVAAVLRRRGWAARAHRCSRPGCEVAPS